MSNTTNNNETMAQKHDRMYRDFPLVYFLAEVAADWKSGDMALSRMESVVEFSLDFLTRIKGYKKFFGKMERIGRMGKGGYSFNPSMGRVTPNEIAAYFDTCIDWCVENGWEHLTANEIAEMHCKN